MEKLKIGIIGAGMMGAQHCEAIRRIPGTEVVALADSDAIRGQELCEKLRIPRFYAGYKDMLVQEKLDVVHNCTPNNMHFDINKDVIMRGVSVYCEKPLALDSKETEELCTLAASRGVKAAVNYNYRQNAVVQEMRERISSQQEWGRTFLVRGKYIQDWMMYDSDYNWRCVKEIGGSSRTVADIGSHWFDTAMFVLGQKITKVNAKFSTVHLQRKKYVTSNSTFAAQNGDYVAMVDIDTEDIALIMLEFENGVSGTVTLSQVSAGKKNALEIAVDGSKYAMEWKQEDADKLLIGNREEGTTMRYAGPEMLSGGAVRYGTLPSGHPVGWHDALRNGIREFYADICGNGDRNRYATFEDGHYIVKLIEACIQSNETGNWVELK